MINTIKFRMGTVVSIPICEDWLKAKLIKIDEPTPMVISAINGVPVDIAHALEELNLGFIIFAGNNVDFSSVDQNVEHIYNALEFDLYRRTMKIGLADLMQLRDLDNWRYVDGVPIELQLSMKILEDEDGFVGLQIRADDDVSSALFRQINSVAGDNYKISVENDVAVNHGISTSIANGMAHIVAQGVGNQSVEQELADTEHNTVVLDGDAELGSGINLIASYATSMALEGDDIDAQAGINLESITDDIIQITGGGTNMTLVANALSELRNTFELDGDEIDLTFGVSVLQNNSGESYLVLQMPDDLDVTVSDPVPCTSVSLDVSTAEITSIGGTVTLTATETPSNNTDETVWTSSDTDVVTVNNGVVTSVGVGVATVTVTCGSYSDSCVVTSRAFMDTSNLLMRIGYALGGTPEYDGVNNTGNGLSKWDDAAARCGGFASNSGTLPIYRPVDPAIYPYVIPKGTARIQLSLASGSRIYDIYRVHWFNHETAASSAASAKMITYETGYTGNISWPVTIDVPTVPNYPDIDSFVICVRIPSGNTLTVEDLESITIEFLPAQAAQS